MFISFCFLKLYVNGSSASDDFVIVGLKCIKHNGVEIEPTAAACTAILCLGLVLIKYHYMYIDTRQK